MFKKIFAAACAALISAAVFTGCGSAPVKDDGRLNIVCTVFPIYDWTRNITKGCDNVEITYLLSSGAEIHSYQPTAEDMIRISDCDMLIYVGGESDKWVEDSLQNARNKNMTVIDLMDCLGQFVVEEEVKEGMADDDNEDSGDAEYDEHIWLSLNQAERCVSIIGDKLSEADAANSQTYKDNAAGYIGELQLLDRSFHLLFDQSSPALIFGDRFPFRYFVEDYGLDYYAAFTGCSADTDASFETITFLAQKADEVGADTIFAIENSDCTIADAVIANTKTKSQKTAVLNSIQSVTQKQIEQGTTYLGLMKNNYDVLKEAFK